MILNQGLLGPKRKELFSRDGNFVLNLGKKNPGVGRKNFCCTICLHTRVFDVALRMNLRTLKRKGLCHVNSAIKASKNVGLRKEKAPTCNLERICFNRERSKILMFETEKIHALKFAIRRKQLSLRFIRNTKKTLRTTS